MRDDLRVTEPADATSPEPPGMLDALGGPWGMVESALPPVAFVAVYSFTDTKTAAIVAVAVALVLSAIRLARRESPVQAVSGLIGVGFAAFVAARSGKATNFFLPGLLANAAYATAFLISIAVRRPLVGVIVGHLDGEGTRWLGDPRRVRAFARASWLWAGLFLVRLVVQLPLYLADAVVALGVVRTAMGLPLFALGLWLTYRLVHRTTPAAT